MARPRPREASMTAPSGSCVLYCGFSKIQSPEKYFKGSCFRRGIKLYASNHVYGVKEEILSETAPSEIVARCIPQMKSTCDYDVRLELSPNPRRIVRGRCSCKAGCRGWCKHAAAVAVFINSHEEKSCTELPRAWGKPSARPTLDTKKQIKELFANGTKSGSTASQARWPTASKRGGQSLKHLQRHSLHRAHSGRGPARSEEEPALLFVRLPRKGIKTGFRELVSSVGVAVMASVDATVH
ncbi:uncharacterized protein LOC144162075 isoform X1 [Haemaphysalis longicornis]